MMDDMGDGLDKPAYACLYCEEPIDSKDQDPTDHRYHRECLQRIYVGSVGHLRKQCSCYGGTEEDPPGLTLREAAKAAHLEFWGSRAKDNK